MGSFNSVPFYTGFTPLLKALQLSFIFDRKQLQRSDQQAGTVTKDMWNFD